MDDVPGIESRLQAYCVKRKIGKGSYGEVFLVTTRDGKKKYVMKNIKLTSNSAKERSDAEQEAALLSRLQHPNIVSYKESFQDNIGVLHIVMGYCEGGDLYSRLKAYGNSLLSETQVVEWFIQIALGLQYLHDRNILHRDLKTQNIFLSRNDIIKVGDLGIARVLDGSCDLAHTVVGTPYYMSPELFANQPYNHKSDIWALGCCVHEIASLKHAFSARSINALMYKVIQGRTPPIPLQYSSELVQLVQHMMAHNAEERPSVHQILCMSFIRQHIKMFLGRAACRKRKGRPPLSPKHQKAEHEHVQLSGSGHTSNVELKNEARLQDHTLQGDGISQQVVPLSVKAENVSSARQRRRKLKQEGYGKPALKSSDERSSDVADGQQDGSKSDLSKEQVAGDSHFPAVDPDPASEVDDFFSLLNSTLHLSAAVAETPVFSAPAHDVVAVGGTRPDHATLPSGRLAERIRALRLECEHSLGVSVVQQVMAVLSSADPEEAEEDLKLVLGVKNFDMYAAKLQQLKLCEDHQFS